VAVPAGRKGQSRFVRRAVVDRATAENGRGRLRCSRQDDQLAQSKLAGEPLAELDQGLGQSSLLRTIRPLEGRVPAPGWAGHPSHSTTGLRLTLNRGGRRRPLAGTQRHALGEQNPGRYAIAVSLHHGRLLVDAPAGRSRPGRGRVNTAKADRESGGAVRGKHDRANVMPVVASGKNGSALRLSLVANAPAHRVGTCLNRPTAVTDWPTHIARWRAPGRPHATSLGPRRPQRQAVRIEH
jgi:hypothetical protein